jgi:hypothetical protein
MTEQPRKTPADGAPDDGRSGPSLPATDREAEHAVPPASDDSEVGGPKGPEPTRFGDWERKGRCIDF